MLVTKRIMIRNIMEMLPKTYTRESVVYNRVAKGLEKMSMVELDSLYCMLLSK